MASFVDRVVLHVAGGDGGGVVGQEGAGDGRVPGGVEVAHGDAGDLRAGAAARGEVVGLLQEEPDDLGADGAGAEDADPQRGCGAGEGGGRLGLLSHGDHLA